MPGCQRAWSLPLARSSLEAGPRGPHFLVVRQPLRGGQGALGVS